MKTREARLNTRGRRVVDVTREVESFARESGGDGLLHAFLLHATAGLALMETGSGSEKDLEAAMDRLLPRDSSYSHAHGPEGHGADHLLPVLVSPSLMLSVADGRVALGTWQRVVVVDPNESNDERTMLLSFLPG